MNEKGKPRHVAIIMDGNGRWATEQGLARSKGHEAGVKTLATIIETALEFQLEGITLYAFSSDNWKRPGHEIAFLMHLFKTYLKRERARCVEQDVHVNVIGRRDRLPRGFNAAIYGMEQATANCSKLTVRIAIDYSSRYSLLQAARLGALDIALDEFQFQSLIDQANHVNSPLPEVDLLIRTGGEQRLSDFLLWEVAYTEFYFSTAFWPEFGPSEFDRAMRAFARRKRRFGALKNILSAVR